MTYCKRNISQNNYIIYIILIADKEFETKIISEDHYIKINYSIHQEYVTSFNICNELHGLNIAKVGRNAIKISQIDKYNSDNN